jgi:hypothetical protein
MVAAACETFVNQGFLAASEDQSQSSVLVWLGISKLVTVV